MTRVEPVTYPFDSAVGLDLDPAYARAREAPGMVRIQLPYGEPAWLALRYDEVGGVLVRAGEPVVVDFASANRDPRRFENADELRFDREDNQHLGFGHGVHHCLGAQFARVELQEGLRALVRKLPGLRIAGEIEWKVEMPVRGARRMPIGW